MSRLVKNGWIETSIENLLAPNENGAIISQGWSPQCEKQPSNSEEDWGVLKTTAIQSGYFREQENKRLPDNLEPKKQHEVKKGDILVTCAGPRNRCGVACLVRNTRRKLLISGKMYRFRVNEKKLRPGFLELFLLSQEAWSAIDKMKTGGSESGLNLTQARFKKLVVPVPPLPEQHAIVAKIEELLSDLDNGVQQLRTAQEQLKIYRQSLLKAAFEGRLTNKGVKDGELPEGWKWVKIDTFLSNEKKGMSTGPFGTMLKKSEHQLEGVPVLGIENIGKGVFQMPNKIFVTNKKAHELKNFRVKKNDIIISRSGTVGEICLLPKKMENSIISTNLIKVSLNQKAIYPKFFVYLFQGGKVRQQVFELCKGSSRAFLNQTILKSLDFPICSLEEQQLVVDELESKLTVCDNIEETITNSLKQAQTLRQSILKKAFEGRLV